MGGMTSAPLITLNDGQSIPQLGLGVWQMTDDEATAAISHWGPPNQTEMPGS